jgi:murein DD-endopeptidase MepM/ murein hydrolase activator NlpD
MTRRGRRQRGRLIPAFIACFYVGITAGWWLHAHFSKSDAVEQVEKLSAAVDAANPVATVGTDSPSSSVEPITRDRLSAIPNHKLRVPIEGMDIETMKGGFAERRDGGRRPHEAVDILAPRHTPVHAVSDGTIAKLFLSKAGGITVYQFDNDQRYCYYYAHLERYADGLREGQRVAAGDVIGYVGTSGNAPPNTPHLHLAVFELTPERRWSDGRAVDPYLAFKQ